MKRDKRELVDRNQAVMQLRLAGKTYGQIATELGLSRCRVFQLIQREKQRTVLTETVAV